MTRAGLIDYGAGNIRSLTNALEHAGAEVQLVRSPSDIVDLTHLVLPGVGAFGFCADRLRQSGLMDGIEDWALRERQPILGICVGMQLLADSSEELGRQLGLGWISGRVQKLVSTDPSVRIPHVGWNDVEFGRAFGEFARGDVSDFYFDHSYAFEVGDSAHVLGICRHGEAFSAAVMRDNIVGVQFHPEKSQEAGLRFLRSFLGR